MVATRAAVDRCDPGHVYPPLSLTGTEDGQGQGGGLRDELHGEDPDAMAKFQRDLLPSRSSSACTTKSPAGGGHLVRVSRQGRKSRSSGTPWSSLPTSLPWCRSSTYLCRRWWTNWCSSSPTPRSPSKVIAVPKISQDSIPQRLLLSEPQLAEQLVEVPTVVSHVLGRALFIGRDGHDWCRVPGPTGVYFRRVGTPHTQFDPPRGIHRQPRAVFLYWARMTLCTVGRQLWTSL